MNTKYIVFGGIVLTAGAIGIGSGGMAIWCLMNQRPPKYFNQHANNQMLPQSVTSMPVAASGAKGSGTTQANAQAVKLDEVGSEHFVIVNGRKITEQELLALQRDDENDNDNPSEPIITVPVQVKPAELSPMRNPASRSVIVNGQEISRRDLAALDFQNRAPISNGHYWYDRISGAWGYEGGPSEGFIVAGMALGGQLRADASNGNTGVFVNGRQLHRREVAALQKLGPVYQGRYWLDAMGNWGIEGGPMMGNLKVAATQVAQNSSGNNGSSWSHRSSYTDSSVGGDGETFYYIDKNSSYISNH